MQEAALWHPCSASAPSSAQDTLSAAHTVSLQSPGRRSLSLQTLLYLDQNFGDTHLASKNCCQAMELL